MYKNTYVNLKHNVSLTLTKLILCLNQTKQNILSEWISNYIGKR